jgi:hypothetical protein
MSYNENTNFANERKYLNNLISGGGGNAEWAKGKMTELNAAEQKYGGGSSGGGSSGGGYSQPSSPGGASGGSTGVIGYSPGGGEYPVGSERGLSFIKNATAGSKIVGSDGSVWLKNKDGSTTITKNGQTYTIGAQGNGASEELEALRRELQQLYGEQGSYAQALAAQQEANRANVQKAVGNLQDQKRDTETSYANMFRQLYLNKMKSQKNIGQQLAAQGKTGGAAESTLLGLDTSYSDALRQGEQGRIGALGDLDRAITDAELTGDIANAELAAANAKERTDSYADVLRDLMDRYDQQNTQNTAYEREDADNARAYAYKTAMQLLQSGSMASDELLESAGISKADAQAMVAAVAAQRAATKSSGRTTSSKPSAASAEVALAAALGGDSSDNVRQILESYYGMPMETVLGAYGYSGGTAPSEAEQLAAQDKNFATWLNEANRLAEGGASVQRLAEILQSWIALGRITQEQGNMIAATFGY